MHVNQFSDNEPSCARIIRYSLLFTTVASLLVKWQVGKVRNVDMEERGTKQVV